MKQPAREPFSDIDGFLPSHASTGGRLRSLLLKLGVEEVCVTCGISEWNGVPLRLHVDHKNGNRADNRRRNLRFLCPNCHSQTDTYGGKNKKVNRRPKATDRQIRKAYLTVCARGVVPSLMMIYNTLGWYSISPAEKIMLVEACSRLGLKLRSQASLEERKEILSARVGSRARSLTTSRYGVKWDDEWLREAIKTRSLKDIAEELGVSDNAVRKRCKTRGILIPATRRAKDNRVPMTREERLEQLAALHGTLNGYKIELMLGMPTCDKCREANRTR